MIPIDLTTGQPCGAEAKAVRPRAWLVEYSGHEAVFLDRARAEQAARDLRGVIVPLFPPGLQATLV